MRTAAFLHDWRVRVLVPVVLINIAAFIGLFKLMDHYAHENVVSSHRNSTALLLDEIQRSFSDPNLGHTPAQLDERLAAQAKAHQLLTINLFDPSGGTVVSTRGTASQSEIAQAQVVLMRPGHPTTWVTEEGSTSTLFSVRPLTNDPPCRSCHSGEGANLGVLQTGVDLTAARKVTNRRVGRNFFMAGAAWLGLLGLMFWTGGVVIGKPISQIQKSMAVAEPSAGRGHDLEALANRIHGTLWDLINSQRQREQDIAQQMARAEQLAALGQVAAGLTHEIKNPLAGVLAALELMRDDETSEKREVYEQILSEIRRVTTTVELLLRLAKPQPPQRTSVDLSKVSKEVSSLFSARLRRQGVALELDIADQVPSLLLDHGLMVQLLVNLLTNALQATDRGGAIKVLVAPFPKDDGVALAVADTGQGIDPDHLDHIFTPFFTTKEEGTGLGMAICKQIVEQHGGTISVESVVGKGTRVLVLLPRENQVRQEEPHGAVAVG